MAWKQMSGKKTVEDSNPSYIDYVITFIAATTETIPSQGDTLADVLGSGTLGDEGLLGEPEAIQISDVVKATVGQDMVTIRFRGFYIES